jgi:hypothetical protein
MRKNKKDQYRMIYFCPECFMELKYHEVGLEQCPSCNQKKERANYLCETKDCIFIFQQLEPFFIIKIWKNKKQYHQTVCIDDMEYYRDFMKKNSNETYIIKNSQYKFITSDFFKETKYKIEVHYFMHKFIPKKWYQFWKSNNYKISFEKRTIIIKKRDPLIY